MNIQQMIPEKNLYPHEGIISEKVLQSLPTLSIAICYLWGIQEPSEFSTDKARRIKNAYSREGRNYLLKHPILLCAVEYNPQILFYILDGHHRTRYAPEFNIRKFPAKVLTLEQAREETRNTIKITKGKLEEWSSRAIEAFSLAYYLSNKDYFPPQPLLASSLNALINDPNFHEL